MFFIHIATLSDADDFVGWLQGKNRLAFNDSEEFSVWLEGQKVFPLSIYLDGITIEFRNKTQMDLFGLGFTIAMRLYDSTHK